MAVRQRVERPGIDGQTAVCVLAACCSVSPPRPARRTPGRCRRPPRGAPESAPPRSEAPPGAPAPAPARRRPRAGLPQRTVSHQYPGCHRAESSRITSNAAASRRSAGRPRQPRADDPATVRDAENAPRGRLCTSAARRSASTNVTAARAPAQRFQPERARPRAGVEHVRPAHPLAEHVEQCLPQSIPTSAASPAQPGERSRRPLSEPGDNTHVSASPHSRQAKTLRPSGDRRVDFRPRWILRQPVPGRHPARLP